MGKYITEVYKAYSFLTINLTKQWENIQKYLVMPIWDTSIFFLQSSIVKVLGKKKKK